MAPRGDDEEPPLDPALQRVQARLRNLMLIAGGTLGLGMFAVFGAILYRIVTSDASDVPAPLQPGTPVPTVARTALGVPADAVLVSVAIGQGTILLAYRHAEGESLVVLDAVTFAAIGRSEIVAAD